MELAVYLNNLIANHGFEESEDRGSLNTISNGHGNNFSGFSLSATLHSVRFEIDLENDDQNASAIMLVLEDIEIWYTCYLSKFVHFLFLSPHMVPYVANVSLLFVKMTSNSNTTSSTFTLKNIPILSFPH